jgi:voltage-gated potassium channel
VPIARWEKLTEWPLTAAAVVFLVAYAAPIIWPAESPALTAACRAAAWITWAVFAGDFVVRIALAERRGRYVLRHWLDVLIIALPLLRPLRLLRLVTLLKVLNRRATSGLRGRVAVYVAGGSVLLAFCGALAVLSVERGHGGNIAGFGDALWWAVETMTTVGYGDRFPVTGQGRLVAVALMLSGIALLGVVTATFATWLVEHVSAAEHEQTEDLQQQLEEMRAQLQEVLDRLPARSDVDRAL